MFMKALAVAALLGGTLTAALPADAQVYGHIGVNIGPPPAPIVERVPAPPGPGYAWRGGHWRWNGVRYVWVHGFYAHHPYGHAAWIPGHWVHRGGGWFWRDGHWA